MLKTNIKLTVDKVLIVLLLMVIATLTYGYRLQLEKVRILSSNIDMHRYDSPSRQLIITNTKHLNY